MGGRGESMEGDRGESARNRSVTCSALGLPGGSAHVSNKLMVGTLEICFSVDLMGKRGTP